ncbi:UNC93-like protein [Drosophila persimilis]|uniref:UNC93-like protein n=1 Tax=Drosophila persimilis TaxID=7234 RepID=UPI000F086F25|nr:UNC93-like protein [Drosophila persimilis]
MNSNERRRSSAATEFLEVVVRPKKYYKAKHPPDHADRDKIIVSSGEKFRILKNVAVISLAMTIQYVAYQGTLNLQSSLNAKEGLGTIALSCIYLSMGISCLLLPTIMIRLLTCKWTLVVGQVCFIPYIALQLYSRFYTLIPAGILLGVFAAPMWAAHATYLTQISQIYAIITSSQMDAVITLFFGIFFFAWQNADTQGNYREQEKYATLANDLRSARLLRDADLAKQKADYYTKQIEEAPDRDSDGEDDELEQDVTVNEGQRND